MLPIPLPLAQLVLSAVNHVTGQQPLLRHALQAHAGQVLRIIVMPPGAAASQGASPGARQAAASALRPQAAPPGGFAATASAASGYGRGHSASRMGTSAGGTHPAGHRHGHPGTHSPGVPAGARGQAAASAGQGGPAAAAGLLPTLQTDARIGADGSLSAVSGDEPAVTLTARLGADALFKALQQGPLALGATLRIEGDVMLATALGEVAKALHWDVEEDLSRLVGDVAAHRAGTLWREGKVHINEVAARAQELLGAHLSSERGVLASQAEARQLAAGLHQLETRIAALEQRLAQQTATASGSG